LDTPDIVLGGKVIPSYCLMPGSITPVVRLDDLVWVIDHFGAQERVLVIEVPPKQLGGVEQPVVVIRQVEHVHLVAYQVADVFTGPAGELRAPDAEAAVVSQRQAHHPDAGEPPSLADGNLEHLQPALHPRQIVGLTCLELGERLVLVRLVVVISQLQAVGRVLEVVEELPDRRAWLDELGQRVSSCS
jgi:hypothetical protein